MSMRFSVRRTVVPNPANRGGYSAYEMPDPNEGQFGDAFPGASRDDRTGAGLMSRADEYRRNYDAEQRQIAEVANQNNPRWNLGPKMIQNAPRDRKWDAFFQAMQEQGVSKLAADAVTPGGSPSFFGDQFGHSGATAPAGYTHQRAMDELKKFQVSGQLPGFATTPGGQLSQLTPGQSKYVQNILDGLRDGMPRYRHYGYR